MVTDASDTSPSNDLSSWPYQYSFCLKSSQVHVIPARLRASMVLRIPPFGSPLFNCPSGQLSPVAASKSWHHFNTSSPHPRIFITVGRPVTPLRSCILAAVVSAPTRQLPLSPSS